MTNDVVHSDRFANGMLIASAASYPVVRGAARVVGRAIDERRRQALIADGEQLTRYAGELVTRLRPLIDLMDAALAQLGREDLRAVVRSAVLQLEEHVRWFTPTNIRTFVENNHVAPGYLYNELGEFLASPMRAMLDALRGALASQVTAALEIHFRELEGFLVRFAAEKFQADISRQSETSHLMRSWLVRAMRISVILALGVAGLLAIVLLSLR